MLVVVSMTGCAGTRTVRTVSGGPPVSGPAAAESFPVSLADSLLFGQTPEEAIAQAGHHYQRAIDAAGRNDMDAARAAIDDILRLMVAISDIQTPGVAAARDKLLEQTATLMRDLQHRQRPVDLKGRIPRVVNTRVSQQLRWWRQYNRGGILTAYARSGLYGDTIRRELAARGMPAELQWLPIVESGYSPRAHSHADAVGLWQFVLDTGKRYGLERTAWTDDRMDPYKATRAAAAYLSDLYDMFGDWLLALAAYNCGEARVLRAVNRQGTDDYWKLILPRETRTYVPRFLAAVYIIENPAQYGFELPELMPEMYFEEYRVERSIAFADVAGVLGISADRLKALNPGVRYGVTPPTGYALRVPLGLAGTLHTDMENIPVAEFTPPPEMQRYRIRSGDTLSHIARRFRTTVRKLRAINGIRGNRIYAGQVIKVPGRTYDDTVYVASASEENVTPSRVVSKTATATRSPQSQSVKTATYTVRRGDTLSKIARRYGTTVAILKQTNRLRSDRLLVGQRLAVPAPASTATGLSKHIVKRGESIWSIARQYALPVTHLLQLNGLNHGDIIKPGQSLILKGE